MDQPNLEIESPNQPISRRAFVRAGVTALSAFLLSACGIRIQDYQPGGDKYVSDPEATALAYAEDPQAFNRDVAKVSQVPEAFTQSVMLETKQQVGGLEYAPGGGSGYIIYEEGPLKVVITAYHVVDNLVSDIKISQPQLYGQGMDRNLSITSGFKSNHFKTVRIPGHDLALVVFLDNQDVDPRDPYNASIMSDPPVSKTPVLGIGYPGSILKQDYPFFPIVGTFEKITSESDAHPGSYVIQGAGDPGSSGSAVFVLDEITKQPHLLGITTRFADKMGDTFAVLPIPGWETLDPLIDQATADLKQKLSE